MCFGCRPPTDAGLKHEDQAPAGDCDAPITGEFIDVLSVNMFNFWILKEKN